LWYAILPRIAPQSAAVIQLSVPVLAIGAGIMLLDESLSLRIAAAAVLVLGGIALALSRPTNPTPNGQGN
jgi:drug/metabolite transporter (DMT)-like permease